MSESPFPDSRPHVEGGPDAPYFSPADLLAVAATGPDMTGAVVEFEPVPGGFTLNWYRCDCPWWHRLPLVGRFVHSDLP